MLTFTTTPDVDGGVKLHFYFQPSSDIKYMPDEGLQFASLTNAANNGDEIFSLDGASGLHGVYQLSIDTDNNQDYFLRSAFNYDQSKIYTISAVADLKQAASLQNRLLFNTVSQASQAASHGDANNPGIAASNEASDIRYTTGSHADIRGNDLAIAMGWKANEKISYGLFGRVFNGSYDAVCDSDGQAINASGKMKSHAVGLFAEYRPSGGENGHYYQAIVNAGRSSNDFRANNAAGGSSFKSGRRLSGATLGGGYIKTIDQDCSTEYYGHFSLTRLGSDNITDSIGQKIRFDSANSFRLLSGARFNFNRSKEASAYLGAALDYEFSGKPNVYIDGNKSATAGAQGFSGLFELGVIAKQSETLSINVGLQGWVGKKRGLSGTMMLIKKF